MVKIMQPLSCFGNLNARIVESISLAKSKHFNNLGTHARRKEGMNGNNLPKTEIAY